MRLTIASLEGPEFLHDPDSPYLDFQRHHVEYETISNQRFSQKRVIIDNCHFSHCSFEYCTFVYSGGLFGFDECEIDDRTILCPTGSAARGIALWLALSRRPEPPE